MTTADERYRQELAQAVTGERADGLIAALAPLALRHQGGDSAAVWEALLLCFDFRAPLPEWVRCAMREAYLRYAEAEVHDLGEAFGLTRPKGWHHEPRQTRDFRVATAMHDALDGGVEPERAFRAVAKKLGLSKRKVTDIWDELPDDHRERRPEPRPTRWATDADGKSRIFRVATAMHDALAAGAKVINETFQAVADQLGLSRSEVREIWYDLPADLRKRRGARTSATSGDMTETKASGR